MFHITEVDKNHSALSGLVSELDAFQSRLYPAESNHCLDFSTVDNEGIRCVIAHDACRLWRCTLAGWRVWRD